jgi:hypothetical protein
MDMLLLTLLLLGATPDGSSIEAPRPQSRAHAVASARIVRGESIDFEKPANPRRVSTAQYSGAVYRIATIRSVGEIATLDGRKIQLQEFH